MSLLVNDKPKNLIAFKKPLERCFFWADTAPAGKPTLRKVPKKHLRLIEPSVQTTGIQGFEVTGIPELKIRGIVKKHEQTAGLNTLFGSVKNYLQLAEKAAPKNNLDHTRLFIGQLLKKLEKIYHLVAYQLDVTTIDSGKRCFTYSFFDSEGFVNKTIENVRQLNHGKNIVKAGLVLVRPCSDALRPKQVLLNSSAHEVKYLPWWPQIFAGIDYVPGLVLFFTSGCR